MRKNRNATLKPLEAELLTDFLEITEIDETNVLALTDIRPSGAKLLIDYTVDNQDVWSPEPLNVIHTDGIVTVDGVDLVNEEYLAYNTHEPIDEQKYTISYTFIPNYTAAPASVINLISLSGDINPGIDEQIVTSVTLRHLLDGNLEARVLDNTGILISSATFPINVVAGNTYKLSLTIDNTVDLDNTMLSLYIDGVFTPSISPTDAKKGTLALIPIIDRFDIGAIYSGTKSSDYIINSIALFSDVIYTETHAVEPYPITVYSTDPQEAYLKDIVSTERLISLTKLLVDDSVKILFEVKNSLGEWIPRYFDLVTEKWLDSDGTYDQANFLDIFNERILYHVWHEPTDVRVKVFLYTVDGYSNSIYESIDLEYDWYLTSIPEIHYTLVYGVIRGSDNKKKSDYRIEAAINDRTIYADKIVMYPENKEAITDDRGYWELLLPDTESMLEDTYVTFTLNPGDNPRIEMCYIPKTTQIDFEVLVKEYNYSNTLD